MNFKQTAIKAAKEAGKIQLRYFGKNIKKKRKLITFVSDKFWNYRSGFTKYFSRVAKLVFGVPIACIKYGLEYNNNHVEKYNQELDDNKNNS